MWSLERTHDSNPNPVIVSLIPTLAKSEPLVLRRVVRSHPESSEVVRSLSEFGVGLSQPESELFEVV